MLTVFRVEEYCAEDVVDSLKKGDVDPKDINRIIYRYVSLQLPRLITESSVAVRSHLHFDHVGDPTPFVNAEFVVGAESKTLLEDAYPINPASQIQQLPPDAKVEFIDFADPGRRTPVAPFGPYARAVDFFGDGALFLVDTPGHELGNVSCAARVAPGAFLFLGGDICHSRLCFDPGHRLVSALAHKDVGAARATVSRLAALHREYPDVVVLLAHDSQLAARGMPFYPAADLKDWALSCIRDRRGTC